MEGELVPANVEEAVAEVDTLQEIPTEGIPSEEVEKLPKSLRVDAEEAVEKASVTEEVANVVSPKEVASREDVVEELVSYTPEPVDDAISEAEVVKVVKELLPENDEKLLETLKLEFGEGEGTTEVKDDVPSESKEDLSAREVLEEPTNDKRVVVPVSLKRIPVVEMAIESGVMEEFVEEEKVSVLERKEMVEEVRLLREEVVERDVIFSEVTREVEDEVVRVDRISPIREDIAIAVSPIMEVVSKDATLAVEDDMESICSSNVFVEPTFSGRLPVPVSLDLVRDGQRAIHSDRAQGRVEHLFKSDISEFMPESTEIIQESFVGKAGEGSGVNLIPYRGELQDGSKLIHFETEMQYSEAHAEISGKISSFTEISDHGIVCHAPPGKEIDIGSSVDVLSLDSSEISLLGTSISKKVPDIKESDSQMGLSLSLIGSSSHLSTVSTLDVPISEDAISLSEKKGSQASVSTFHDVSDEPRRPVLSKSRREQLSILTKKVLTENEMNNLISEVKEVTRQIKQEVKELKPDLTPTPEGQVFPSQSFLEDFGLNLSSISEERTSLLENEKASGKLESPSIVVAIHSSYSSVPTTDVLQSPKSKVEPPSFVLPPSFSSEESSIKKASQFSSFTEDKSSKVVTIIEEEVVLDNVTETVVEELQTVSQISSSLVLPQPVTDELSQESVSHSIPPLLLKEISCKSSAESKSLDDMSHVSTSLDVSSHSVSGKSILESPTVEDLSPKKEESSILQLSTYPSLSMEKPVSSSVKECILDLEALSKEDVSSDIDIEMQCKIQEEILSPASTPGEDLESTILLSKDLPPMDEEVGVEKEELQELKVSTDFKPKIALKTDDIVLKDDDTIEVTLSEENPHLDEIESESDSHLETTLHTASSGATFVEINKDGQRSICVCEKIVKSQILSPKESESLPKKMESVTRKGAAAISRTKVKEPSKDHPIRSPIDSAESQGAVRKRPIPSKLTPPAVETDLQRSKKKITSRSLQLGDVQAVVDTHRKSTYGIHSETEERSSRHRVQKKSHYAEDTASSSSKKVSTTHRREDTFSSRATRMSRDTSGSVDSTDRKLSPARKSVSRKDEYDHAIGSKKVSSEIERKIVVREESSRDSSTTSKRQASLTTSSKHQLSQQESTKSMSPKSLVSAGAISKLPRSTSLKKKEAKKIESELSRTVDSTAQTSTHATSSVVRQTSTTHRSSKAIEKTVISSTKHEKKIKSQSKVIQPTRTIPEIPAVASTQKVQPSTSVEIQAFTAKPQKDVSPETPLSQKTEDISSEESVTISSPSPSFYQPSPGVQESSSRTPSLPSSPSRMRHSSTTSGSITQLMTSEVFTRTLDVTGAIEVIYRQPTSSESLRRIAPTKSTQLSTESTSSSIGMLASPHMDSAIGDTTDSSLSDSIALPSSSSDLDFSGTQEGNRHFVSRSSTIISTQKTSHPSTPSHLYPSPSSNLPQPTLRRTGRTMQVSEERLSPILDVRAVTPPRVKHKFEYVDDDDEVEESGDHPQGKLHAPHHSARCHQLFSTSASVQSMASHLEQIISDVRKDYWPSDSNIMEVNKFLEMLQSQAQSLTKLAVELPKRIGVVEGKLDYALQGHRMKSPNNDNLNLLASQQIISHHLTRDIAQIHNQDLPNNNHNIVLQKSDVGGIKEDTKGIPSTLEREELDNSEDSHHIKNNIDDISSSGSEGDYALIESNYNLESFENTSTDEEQDLIPVDLTDLNFTETKTSKGISPVEFQIDSEITTEKYYNFPSLGNSVDLSEVSILSCYSGLPTEIDNSDNRKMSSSESKVPLISVTHGEGTEGEMDEVDEIGRDIVDSHTDIEDLETDFEDMAISKDRKNLLVKPLVGDLGTLTDTEDLEASGDEDEEPQIDLSSPQIVAALEDALDTEGNYEELFKYDSVSNSGKTIVSSGKPMFQGLGFPEDSKTSGVATDVEDFSASDEDTVVVNTYPEVTSELIGEMLENSGSVEIEDNIKRLSSLASPLHTPKHVSSPALGHTSPEDGYLGEAAGISSPYCLSPIPSGNIRASAATDTEMLDSDSEEEISFISKSPHHLKERSSLKPPRFSKGSATDVEDIEFSDDERYQVDKKDKYSSKLLYDQPESRKERVKLSYKSKHHQQAERKGLGIHDEPEDLYTDVEDVEASGPEDDYADENSDNYLKEPLDKPIFSIEEMEGMYGNVMESQATLDSFYGQLTSTENPLTDTEDLAVSSPLKYLRKREVDDQSSISSECSTEEGSVQGSDSETRSGRRIWRESKASSQIQASEVKFIDQKDGKDPVPVLISPNASGGRRSFLLKSAKVSLLPAKPTDGGITDVEELLSSDDSAVEESMEKSKKEITENLEADEDKEEGATDFEDFEEENLEDIDFSPKLPPLMNPEDIPGFPPPVRELTLVKQDNEGHPTVLVLPLDDVKARGLFNPDEPGAAVTDIEDMADSGDDIEDSDLGLRVIDADGNKTILVTPDLPNIEGGVIETTESMKVEKKKLKLPSQAMADPTTDVEEMFIDTSPSQRRRKVRPRPQGSSSKKSPLAATSSAIAVTTTDVEEIEVSDVESLPPQMKLSESQNYFTGEVNEGESTPYTSDGKTTDLEDMEASDIDENFYGTQIREITATPEMLQAYGLETISEKQGDGPFSEEVREKILIKHSKMRSYESKSNSRKQGSLNSLPTIRMTSPSPDIPTTTDTEDIFASADEEKECPTPPAVDITFEFEEHSSVVHVKHTRKIDVDAPGEAMYVKGHRTLEAHTDVEDLGLSEEESHQNDGKVDFAGSSKENQDLDEHSEKILSQVSVYEEEKKICVCMGSENQDVSEKSSKVCICIGKPKGDLTVQSESSVKSEMFSQDANSSQLQQQIHSEHVAAREQVEGMADVGPPLPSIVSCTAAPSPSVSICYSSRKKPITDLTFPTDLHSHGETLAQTTSSVCGVPLKCSVSEDKESACSHVSKQHPSDDPSSPPPPLPSSFPPPKHSEKWHFPFRSASFIPVDVSKKESLTSEERITAFSLVSKDKRLKDDTKFRGSVKNKKGNLFHGDISHINSSSSNMSFMKDSKENKKVLGKEFISISQIERNEPLSKSFKEKGNKIYVDSSALNEQSKNCNLGRTSVQSDVKRNSKVILKATRVEPQSMRARAGSVSKLISKFEGLSLASNLSVQDQQTSVEPYPLTSLTQTIEKHSSSSTSDVPVVKVCQEDALSETSTNSQQGTQKNANGSNENVEPSSFKPVIRFTFLKDRSISPRRLDPNPIQESEAFKALCRDIKDSSIPSFNRQSYRSLPTFSSSSIKKHNLKPSETPTQSMPKLNYTLSRGAMEPQNLIQLRSKREVTMQRSHSLTDRFHPSELSIQRELQAVRVKKDQETLAPPSPPCRDRYTSTPTPSISATVKRNSFSPSAIPPISQQSLQMSATRRRILDSLMRLRTRKVVMDIPSISSSSQTSLETEGPFLENVPSQASSVRVRGALLKSPFIRSASSPPPHLRNLPGEGIDITHFIIWP
ncbi:hypothetical protein J437_LFUL009651 [Ladona fulva]|uniref:Uncharacterized protein n=1 Tax=Ladona fulva TaxID=123851 RepID=A0A8K0K973_LADFU|nr:hypothetical protein J437_LFUL009651 [Ladona fulva]